jgi:hypothetical protein
MAFDWLNRFQSTREKTPDYAEKALAAYRRGMKANGAIVGVRIEVGPDGCESASKLLAAKVYEPEEAPSLPLPGCPIGRCCGCVYRPVMNYEQSACARRACEQTPRTEEGSEHSIC